MSTTPNIDHLCPDRKFREALITASPDYKTYIPGIEECFKKGDQKKDPFIRQAEKIVQTAKQILKKPTTSTDLRTICKYLVAHRYDSFTRDSTREAVHEALELELKKEPPLKIAATPKVPTPNPTVVVQPTDLPHKKPAPAQPTDTSSSTLPPPKEPLIVLQATLASVQPTSPEKPAPVQNTTTSSPPPPANTTNSETASNDSQRPLSFTWDTKNKPSKFYEGAKFKPTTIDAGILNLQLQLLYAARSTHPLTQQKKDADNKKQSPPPPKPSEDPTQPQVLSTSPGPLTKATKHRPPEDRLAQLPQTQIGDNKQSPPPPKPSNPPEQLRSLPISPLPLTGLGNTSCNCWANALMQMIEGTPSLLKAYIAIGNHYAKSEDPIEKIHGENLLTIHKAYLFCAKKKTPVPEEYSQSLRSFFHYISDTIRPHSWQQEDANEAFQLLLSQYEEILKINSGKPPTLPSQEPNPEYHNIHPEFFTLLTINTILEKIGPEYNPVTELEKNRDIIVPDKQGRTVLSRSSFDCRIALTLSETGPLDFPTLFSAYFFSPAPQNSEILDRLVMNHQQELKSQNFRQTTYEAVYERSPLELIVTPNRFTPTLDAKGKPVFTPDKKIVYKKINTEIDVPLTLTLPEGAIKTREKPRFELTSFVVHIGTTPSFGHYVCYRKEGDKWFCCNDSSVTIALPPEVDAARKRGYFYHYQRM